MNIKNLSNVFVADLETTTTKSKYYKTTNDVTTILFHIANLVNADQHFTGTNLDEFFNYLKDYSASSIVYFHNLSFDGHFICAWLRKNGFIISQREINTKSKANHYNFLINGAKIFNIKVSLIPNKHWTQRKHCITVEFKCSAKLLVSSVAKLGDAINLPKLDTDLNVEPVNAIADLPNQFVEYCKRDVDIVRQTLINFNNAFNLYAKKYPYAHNFNWVNKVTLAGLSYDLLFTFVFRVLAKMQKKNKFYSQIKYFKKESYNLVKPSFLGGLTLINLDYINRLVECVNGKSYDLNSSYPYAMFLMLPYGDVLLTPPNGNYLTLYHFKIEFCLIREKYKNIPCMNNWKKTYNNLCKYGLFENEKKFKDLSHDNKVSHLDNFECWYWADEWDLMNKIYEFQGVKVLDVYYFAAKNYLSNWITSLYNTRLEYKKLNPPLANFCKIVMNAGYGKFGQRPFENVIFNTKEIPVGDIIVDRNTQYKKLKNKNMLFEFWGIDYSIVEKIRLKTTKNISVASYITSVGRCNLLKAMISIGFENIAYTDTDSIYLINAPKNIDKIIQISEKKLGDWKLEKTYHYIKVVRAKVYGLYDQDKKLMVHKVSGIKDCNDDVLEQILGVQPAIFETTFSGVGLTAKICESGIALIDRPYTLKKSFKNK